MARDINAAWVTAQHVRLGLLVEVEVASGTLRLWTGGEDLSWDGHIWTGAGNLLAIEFAAETVELRAEGVRLTLNGCNPDILATALEEVVQGKPVNIWLAWFDTAAPSWVLLSDSRNPYKIFGGGADVPTITIGKDGLTVSLTAESILTKLERAPGRRYTSEDQKAEFPDDKGFDFVTSQQGRQSNWGAGPTGTKPKLSPNGPPMPDTGTGGA